MSDNQTKSKPEPAPPTKDGDRLAALSCSATFELANGEYVSPCHKPKNHKGACQGYVLGSRCSWPKGYSSEYEIYMKSKSVADLAHEWDLIAEGCKEYHTVAKSRRGERDAAWVEKGKAIAYAAAAKDLRSRLQNR